MKDILIDATISTIATLAATSIGVLIVLSFFFIVALSVAVSPWFALLIIVWVFVVCLINRIMES